MEFPRNVLRRLADCRREAPSDENRREADGLSKQHHRLIRQIRRSSQCIKRAQAVYIQIFGFLPVNNPKPWNHKPTCIVTIWLWTSFAERQFGLKNHGSDGSCQNRRIRRPRLDEHKDCGRRTTANMWFAPRFSTPWPTVLLQLLLLTAFRLPTESSEACSYTMERWDFLVLYGLSSFKAKIKEGKASCKVVRSSNVDAHYVPQLYKEITSRRVRVCTSLRVRLRGR